jgi:hypothetical protein
MRQEKTCSTLKTQSYDKATQPTLDEKMQAQQSPQKFLKTSDD